MIQNFEVYDVAKHQLASDEEELVPAEMVDRILAGEHPNRAWRHRRGLTLARLAERAGVSGSYLSQIEAGRREGAVERLRPIAEALDLGLDDVA